MKTNALLIFILLGGWLFAQEATLSVGGFGRTCNGGSGFCSVTNGGTQQQKSTENANSFAIQFIKLSDAYLQMKIDLGNYSKKEMEQLLGVDNIDFTKTKQGVYTLPHTVSIEENALKTLELDAHWKEIPSGEYPFQVTERQWLIIVFHKKE